MYLGSEVFDVTKQSLHGDFNHMFIRQGTGLQGQAIFRTKLSFRPHSTESKTHQKMTRQMADRSHKAAGIKVISQVRTNGAFCEKEVGFQSFFCSSQQQEGVYWLIYFLGKGFI